MPKFQLQNKDHVAITVIEAKNREAAVTEGHKNWINKGFFFVKPLEEAIAEGSGQKIELREQVKAPTAQQKADASLVRLAADYGLHGTAALEFAAGRQGSVSRVKESLAAVEAARPLNDPAARIEEAFVRMGMGRGGAKAAAAGRSR